MSLLLERRWVIKGNAKIQCIQISSVPNTDERKPAFRSAEGNGIEDIQERHAAMVHNAYEVILVFAVPINILYQWLCYLYIPVGTGHVLSIVNLWPSGI